MMSRITLTKTSPLIALCRKTPFLSHHLAFKIPRISAQFHGWNSISIEKTAHLCTVSAIRQDISSPPSIEPLGSHNSRKAPRLAPEAFVLGHKLDQCSKRRDLGEALRIYDEARANNIRLNVHHYNVLLYLCAARNNCGEGDSSESNLELGLQIFGQMRIDNIAPNEATFTGAARLAAAKQDPEMAFDLVKQMKSCGIVPKLRSYGPALFGFCEKMMTDKAYEVDAHMVENGVLAEEQEILALLKLSSEAKIADKVYEMMHRMRVNLRQVSEETAGVIEDWFMSDGAVEVGMENWDVGKVKKGVVKGGGGWHGQGWLGKGKWRVVRTQIMENGVCRSCGEKLVSIDIDPKETENFADSVAKLACQREVSLDFVKFKEWLKRHGPFDAVVDGANIGLCNQKNFNFHQLRHVVNQLRQRSKSERSPLVILHKSRVSGGPARLPNNKKLLDSWKNAGALYATPRGSSDDLYWLYAAVSSKCLLVTNDEMRDHLFQLLGTSFFPRWKEKHQVRITNGCDLQMPPPYSIVIQESEQGSWHVPTITGDDFETQRKWICATRRTMKDLHSGAKPSLGQNGAAAPAAVSAQRGFLEREGLPAPGARSTFCPESRLSVELERQRVARGLRMLSAGLNLDEPIRKEEEQRSQKNR